jgi:hypothetical protein
MLRQYYDLLLINLKVFSKGRVLFPINVSDNPKILFRAP